MKRRTLLKGVGTGALVATSSTTTAAMATKTGDDGDAASAPSDCSDYTECDPCLDDPNCGLMDCDACA